MSPEGKTLGEATVDVSGSSGAGTGEGRASPGDSAALPGRSAKSASSYLGCLASAARRTPPCPQPRGPGVPGSAGMSLSPRAAPASRRGEPTEPAAWEQAGAGLSCDRVPALGARVTLPALAPGEMAPCLRMTVGLQGDRGHGVDQVLGKHCRGVVTSAVRVCPVSWSSSRSPEQCAALPRPS